MLYQVLARKWRPRRFTEMVGQEHVLRALTNALDSGRLHHAFLFTGTRGVGKTTLARILAKSLNCESGVSSSPCGQCSACTAIDEGRFVDLIEVDAASRTKVEDTRDLLDNVQYAPSQGRYKVYLIDEVHMLSNHSFNALLKTLEEPPPHVKFLFATTDPQKLPVTILSRCLQFNLKRLYPELIRKHLAHILQQENIEQDDAALKRIAKAADGSMRDALSLLDQAIAYGAGKVIDHDVRDMLGSIEQTHIYDLLEALAVRNGKQLLAVLQHVAERSPDYAEILAELLSCLHHLALLQQIPDAYDEAMGDQARLQRLQAQFTAEDVQLYYQIGVVGRRDLAYAPNPSLGLEMTLLRMLAFHPQATSSTNKMDVPAAIPPATKAIKKPEAIPSPPTTTSAPELAVESFTGQVTAQPEWLNIILQLKLTAMVKELAMHSVLRSIEEKTVQLVLDAACKNLLTDERRANLESALQTHLGRAVRVSIELGNVQQDTPASYLQRQQQARQAAAQSAIQNDGNVQKMIETFGAQVRTDTIQPVD